MQTSRIGLLTAALVIVTSSAQAQQSLLDRTGTRKAVRPNGSVVLNEYWTLGPNCAEAPVPSVSVVRQPKLGRLATEPVRGAGRGACPTGERSYARVVYQAGAAPGVDTFQYLVIFAGGRQRLVQARIDLK